MRAEMPQGPGELGRRLDDTLREVLVRAARPEFVIAAFVPMPAGPVRIKAENFFPLDLGLLLDSRVVDLLMAYNPTFVMLSFLKPLFFNSLKNALRFSDNAGA